MNSRVKKIKTLLIANRGEIACRVIKTAKKMGIKTVAVYSESDNNSLHVQMADKAFYIGPSPAPMSYLNKKNIIDAIKSCGADAVHPGYGFLSENAEFAELLDKYNIKFVGPSAESISAMGDKIRAKKIAQEAGVNVVPGYLGELADEQEALKIAEDIGYPIMLKAAAGGGGKGMRVVRSPEEMKQAFQSTRREAKNSFSDERTFIEKFIENPRHIEIQVLGDKYGNYVCFGERECSIQRHHQKVIEEAPSSFVDEEMRQKMYEQSVMLARKVGYYSAGTVEYIVDQNKNFYFLEMNTRLQVEHPVTELVTGYDLVELMIRVAAGEELPLKQEDVKLKGWAFEARICAEDPTCGFLPSTGRVYVYHEPEATQNVRIDSGMYEGGEVSMFYDSMISKLCSYGQNRLEAIEHLQQALDKYVIRGITHNIGFVQAILGHEKFQSGNISTNFISQEYGNGFSGAEIDDESTAVLLASAVFIFLKDAKRASEIEGKIRSANQTLGTRWVVKLDESNYPVTVRPINGGYKITFENHKLYITSKWVLGTKLFQSTINDKEYNVQIEHHDSKYSLAYMGRKVSAFVYTPRTAELYKFMRKGSGEDAGKDLLSNISGMVVDIKVAAGDNVVKGQPLMIIEAMKMENILVATADGVAKQINVKEKEAVNTGDVLIEIE